MSVAKIFPNHSLKYSNDCLYFEIHSRERWPATQEDEWIGMHMCHPPFSRFLLAIPSDVFLVLFATVRNICHRFPFLEWICLAAGGFCWASKNSKFHFRFWFSDFIQIWSIILQDRLRSPPLLRIKNNPKTSESLRFSMILYESLWDFFGI